MSTFQHVRIGQMESGEYAPTSKRRFAVWDGPHRVAAGMTRGEALAFAAGIQWGEVKTKMSRYRNIPWRFTP